jgi:class 3 adenylate cyclase
MIRATVRVSGAIGFPLQVRVGLDSGPLVAGIIGERKPMYDLWGDTVNTASRMESHGVPGAVHMTDAVRDALRDVPPMQSRVIEVKGKGEMRTWIWNPAAGNARSHGSDAAPAARSADWGAEAGS